MPESNFQRYLLTLRLVFSLILCASVAFYVYKSIGWQVMHDTSIMHYVNFLIDRGLAPYRDIIDCNMPGSYFMEGWAMHVFGGGDLGWRFYDFFLLGILTASLIVISLPYDWFAGLFAGVFFLLIHGLEGPRNAGQREQLMITLIMIGYALLFTALRRQKPWFMLPFGLALGLAASLKPTAAALGLVLLLMMAVALRRKVIPIRSYLSYGVLGLLVALLINLGFLFRYHAFHSFVAISKRLLPFYATVGNQPPSFLMKDLLLEDALPRKMIAMVAIAVIFTIVNRTRREWEKLELLALGIGVLFGIFSFVAQGKAFEHHAYAFKVFVFLWFGLECTKAMRTRGVLHVAGLAAIGFCVLAVVPKYTYRMASVAPLNEQPDGLKSDLIRLGGSKLQNQVQCLDLVDNCLSTLYRLRLVSNTYFIGDYMFFGPVGSPPQPYYRNMLWNDLHKNPPKVIVLTNEWLCEPNSFKKIDQWPQLAEYLNSAYTLDVSRTFGESSYKIFLLKNETKPAEPVARPNA